MVSANQATSNRPQNNKVRSILQFTFPQASFKRRAIAVLNLNEFDLAREWHDHSTGVISNVELNSVAANSKSKP